jgi:hypothetical protein
MVKVNKYSKEHTSNSKPASTIQPSCMAWQPFMTKIDGTNVPFFNHNNERFVGNNIYICPMRN